MMLFPSITEILPKTGAAGIALWAAVSYLGTGPEVGARIAHFDHAPTCKAHHVQLVQAAAQAEMQALTPPSAETDMALNYAESIFGNELFTEFGKIGGWGGAWNDTMRQYRERQRQVQEEYVKAKAAIEANTRRKLANSDGFCGCVADAAIDESRNDLAMYAGSVGLISSSKIENFGAVMFQPENLAKCAGMAKEKA